MLWMHDAACMCVTRERIFLCEHCAAAVTYLPDVAAPMHRLRASA